MGAERYVELTPRTSGEGRDRVVHSFMPDVTAQVTAERDALWLSTAINDASVPLCIIDAAGVIQTVNAALAALLGRPASELVGREGVELLPEAERDARRARFAAAGRGEPVAVRPLHVERPDGSVVTLSATGSPMLTPEGCFRGMCLIGRDISDHVAAEREMAEQLALLQQRSASGPRSAAVTAETAAQRKRAANASERVRMEAIDVLLVALDARDHYTCDHSHKVVELSLAVAERFDFDEAQRADVEYVALLHDIGKLGVPDRVLMKRGSLTEQEWELMREHPAIGERIVAGIASLEHLAPAIRAEHERWDGTGYPDGLRGEEIPIASRIGLACDAWHAMTSDRPYRLALPEEQALAELERNSGTQFDPRVVDALLAVLTCEEAAAA